MSQADVSPWYKQFWAWFVLAPLIVVVIVGGIMLTIAYHYADDVVTDNYYKEGRMINQRLEQDQQATQLGLFAEVKFDFDSGEAHIKLDTEKTGVLLPKKLLFLLNHPTSAVQDHILILTEWGAGRYRVDLEERLDYRWYVVLMPALETDQTNYNQAAWRLTGEIDFRQSATVSLHSR